MKPFIYNEKQEEDFYEQFDGVKILPSIFLEDYRTFLEQNQFIKAENIIMETKIIFGNHYPCQG
jgi:hypothetical protein